MTDYQELITKLRYLKEVHSAIGRPILSDALSDAADALEKLLEENATIKRIERERVERLAKTLKLFR